jgi:hypothetical protein
MNLVLPLMGFETGGSVGFSVDSLLQKAFFGWLTLGTRKS